MKFLTTGIYSAFSFMVTVLFGFFYRVWVLGLVDRISVWA